MDGDSSFEGDFNFDGERGGVAGGVLKASSFTSSDFSPRPPSLRGGGCETVMLLVGTTRLGFEGGGDNLNTVSKSSSRFELHDCCARGLDCENKFGLVFCRVLSSVLRDPAGEEVRSITSSTAAFASVAPSCSRIFRIASNISTVELFSLSGLASWSEVSTRLWFRRPR